MPIKILMPALSPTMTEGKIAKWLKSEGDVVRSGDVVAEIETDKATMEVEAADEGLLGRILVPAGTEGVSVNTPIALLLEEGEDASALKGEAAKQGASPERMAEPEPHAPSQSRNDVDTREGGSAGGASPAKGDGKAAASPLARRMAEQAGISLGGLEGSGPHGKIVKRDIEGAVGGKPADRGAAARADNLAVKAQPRKAGERVFSSPLAKRMAEQAGLDLAAIGGSGPEGRVIKRDVETALREGIQPRARAEAEARPAGQAPSQPAELPPAGAYTEVPNSSIRKIIAQRLGQSKREIPHFYVSTDCRVDNLLDIRRRLNEKAPKDGAGAYKLSVNDFVIRACAVALKRMPQVNASWNETAIRVYRDVDVSMAVATPNGLITPVIRVADTKGIAAISNEARELAKRARDGKLKPEEYQGGGFTISNLGMYGVRDFYAIINPPQACILAVGAAEQQPVVKDGQLAIGTVMRISLSADHRVVDGAVGAEFISLVKELLEEPLSVML
jgi:pyruvate dehydrogenase E2 component (dihydrolipoamide acetyltransferase)